MDDSQSSNPIEPALDAASEVLGTAIGAMIDPFGSSGTENDSRDEPTEEARTADAADSLDDPEEHADDSDENTDDDGDYYDVGDERIEYTVAASSQGPIKQTTNYYHPDLSQSPPRRYEPSEFNALSNAFSTPSDTGNSSVGDLFSSVGKSLLVGMCLYPVVGLGGCLTRLVIQGPPPHPMYQQQAHDQWLNSPVNSWTTEAVIIPLTIIAITFFTGLIKIGRSNPMTTFLLFLLGGAATIFVGIGLTNSVRQNSRNTPTVNASTQPVGTIREVNAIKLNMRSGPGSNHSIVATFSKKARILSYGETLKVNGELWTQACTPDGQTKGWVNRKFLSP